MPAVVVDAVEITYTERGAGRAVLLLHGGAGPVSVTAYADRLAAERPVRVITPVHPGFDGTPRPTALTTIGQLAALYAGLLRELDLNDVTVVGNSIGGWITAELGLLHPERVAHLVIVDAVGLEVPGHPIVDFFSLPFPEIAELSYHEPEKYRIDPTALPPAAQAAMAANRKTLAVYATSMTDPTLLGRLSGITTPTTVVWGSADRIVDPEHGRTYAKAIPGAGFHLLEDTGHLPQIESPDRLTPLLDL